MGSRGLRAPPLSLDLHHRVGESLDDLLALRRREDALESLDFDERYVVLLVGRLRLLVILGTLPAERIGRCP
jgi:hypothetical protein